MERIHVTIAPEIERVRVLARRADKDLLKAVLPPASHCHPRAAATLLEGLALWHQRPLSVVLYVDDRSRTSASALYEGLNLDLAIGAPRLHYELELALRAPSGRRRGRVYGLGDFRDLRQLSFPEVER